MTERDDLPLDNETLPDDVDLADEAIAGPPSGRWTRRLALIVLVAALALLVRFGGDAIYNPPSRLPQTLAFTRDEPLFGPTSALLAELELIADLFPEDEALQLRPFGTVYELDLPRTLADRLFAERRERATVFTATTPDGREQRFLQLSDGKSRPIYAAESVQFPRSGAGPAGLFVAIPPGPPFVTLTAALAGLDEELSNRDKTSYAGQEYVPFGPFASGDQDALQEDITGSPVLRHLVAALAASSADVSLTAPLFLVFPSRSQGTVRALYQSQFGAVLEPPWGDSRTATLAHELVHAYMDKVASQPDQKLTVAAGHFEEAHPRLFGRVISELYSQLDRRGRAEEAVANIVGALAAGETRTVEAAVAVSANRGAAEIAEPILRSDVLLLLGFDLLPECMDPDALGYEEATVSFAYYDLVRESCES